MQEKEALQKMEQMKKNRKILFAASLILMFVSLAALVYYNFAPVARLVVDGTDKFGNGQDYPGWQMIYYGIGRQYIPGYYEFGFNPVTCVGMFLPVLTLIICSCLYGRGKNLHKAKLEFVMAGALLIGGTILFCVTKIAPLVASNEGLNSFKNAYLLPAIEAGTFTLLTYPKVLFAICIITAAVKAGNGVFLIQQKKLGRTLKELQKRAEKPLSEET